jgi:hypothetical protein
MRVGGRRAGGSGVAEVSDGHTVAGLRISPPGFHGSR